MVFDRFEQLSQAVHHLCVLWGRDWCWTLTLLPVSQTVLDNVSLPLALIVYDGSLEFGIHAFGSFILQETVTRLVIESITLIAPGLRINSLRCATLAVWPLLPAPHCRWISSVMPRFVPALVVDPSLPSGRMLIWTVQHAQATQHRTCILGLLLTYFQTELQICAIQQKRHRSFLLAVSDISQIVSLQWRGLGWMPYMALFSHN